MTQTNLPGGRTPSGPVTGQRARRRRLWIAALATTAVLALIGLAVFAVSQNASGPDTQRSATSSSAAQGPARVGETFPDFALTTADGEQVTAADLRGRDTILWFTTTYCVPCQEGALAYQPVAQQLGSAAPRMLFVFVDPQEPNSALLDFRTRFGLPDWLMALDSDGLAQRASVQVLDTKIFVDETGTVANIDTAPINDAYLDTVRRLSTAA